MESRCGILCGKCEWQKNGKYMNKQHWNSVNPNGEIEDELLKDLLDKSYNLVLGGFSRKKQSEILESAGEADGI